MSKKRGTLELPAQAIPVPQSLSPEARAFLAGMVERVSQQGEMPDPVTDGAELAVQRLGSAAAAFAGTFETSELDHGALLYRAAPQSAEGRLAEVAYFDIHGGGFIAGGGVMCRMLAKIRAADYGATVYSVDYRLAPAHPYPAALDDCMAAYCTILESVHAANLVIGGSSAGGNLAAALLLRARAEGLPMPAGLLLMTPATDMTASGDSRVTNRLLDVSLYGGAGAGPADYLGASNPRDPYLSPLFGEIGSDWPPTLLTTGTRDLLLSDTVMMHRKLREAGVDAQLLVTEAGLHIGFMGSAPEDHYIMGEARNFVQRAWGIA